MLIQVLSDLHIEFKGNNIPALAPGAEIVILAGDLAPVRTRRVAEVAERWRHAKHIRYVPGNHEFYGSDIEDARRELARQCQRHGVTLLDRRAIAIDRLHFSGATLWTDFLLDGIAEGHWAHHATRRQIADFMGAIRDRSAPGRLLTARESTRRQAEDRAFIESELREAQGAALTLIVITTTRRAALRAALVRGRCAERGVRLPSGSADCTVPATALVARTHARPRRREARRGPA